MKLDTVNVFAVFIRALITELDSKSENLFRMCSVATNPVTSLEFNPIRCAITLCHFGPTRNSYVATHFILLSSTAERKATSSYAVVPKRFGQNAEPASRNKERTMKRPSFVTCSGFLWCNNQTHVNMNLFHYLYEHYFIFIFCNLLMLGEFFSNLLLWKNSLILFILVLNVSTRESVHEIRNGRKGVYFPPVLEFFPL